MHYQKKNNKIGKSYKWRNWNKNNIGNIWRIWLNSNNNKEIGSIRNKLNYTNHIDNNNIHINNHKCNNSSSKIK